MTGFLAWLRGGRPFPYPRHTAGSAMAMLYFAGGLTTLLILLLPHPATLDIGVMLVIGGVSPLLGLAILRLRFRLATSAYPWLLVVGTGIVTVLMATAGSRSASGSFSFFYTWIVIYALLFFSPVSAAAQVGVAAAAYLTVWVSLDPSETDIGSTLEPVILVSVIGTTGLVVRMLSRAREVSEIDSLTGVANRRGLDRLLDSAVEETTAAQRTLVVAMIDIDHFKSINDMRGHAAGDQVLECCTRAWRPLLRLGDSLARFGGDEFVVVLPGCSRSDAEDILERLRVAAPDDITCSVGAALWQPGDTVSMLVGRADVALYQAKNLGRNRLAWAFIA